MVWDHDDHDIKSYVGKHPSGTYSHVVMGPRGEEIHAKTGFETKEDARQHAVDWMRDNPSPSTADPKKRNGRWKKASREEAREQKPWISNHRIKGMVWVDTKDPNRYIEVYRRSIDKKRMGGRSKYEARVKRNGATEEVIKEMTRSNTKKAHQELKEEIRDWIETNGGFVRGGRG